MTQSKLQLRLPQDIKSWLEAEANKNSSSQNSELIRAVREKMDRATQPAFSDSKINLLEFARIVKDGEAVSETIFVQNMRRVLPLDDLRNLTPDEAEWLHMAIAWLHDYSILLFEFHQSERGTNPELMGSPWLPGVSGPFILNMLTRGCDKADFSPLEHFGLNSPPTS